jgi:GT2 family glycosyltransferase
MANCPELSIIIVNWNSREFLRKCLLSLRDYAQNISHEIIVVDNASFDGCEEMLRSDFPSVVFIQAGKNLGFSRGNNFGVERSSGRHLLFLNPDTEIVGDALATLVSVAHDNPQVGIVGARLLNSDLTVQMESIRSFPSLLNQILESHYLRSRFPRLSIWGMRPLFDRADDPAGVDVVSGACLLIKREVFERVGGFSAQYFMYSEDVDLCYKVKEAGWTTVFVDSAQVVHHGGGSSALSPVSQFGAVMIRESRFRFLRMARGNVYAIMYRAVTAVIAVWRLALLMVLYPFMKLFLNSSPANGIRKWSKILRWSLGLETWVTTVGMN